MAEILINEFLSWFTSLAQQGQTLPKVISGIKSNGEQFFLYPYDIPIDSSEHLDFMRTILLEEEALAFVISYRLMALNEDTKEEEERRTFFSGESGRYFTIEVAPNDSTGWASGIKVLHQEESAEPSWFLGDLLSEPSNNEGHERFLKIWGEARPHIHWIKRESSKFQ